MKSPASSSRDYVAVVDTSRSPYACMRQAGLDEVVIEDDFWCSRRQINCRVMLPAQYRLLEETGRIDNFRRASGRKKIDFQGIFFNDSDVYKWLEAAIWSLSASPDGNLTSLIDGVIDEICAAQRPDGYLNTYFTFENSDRRWTDFDLHELYCAGHLMQAAIAHRRVTGKSVLLDAALRFADHICDWFGDAEGKHFGSDGHPEIEMALVELYRQTGDEKYLRQANYFLDVRGSGTLVRNLLRDDPRYYQDHLPFIQSTRMEGHAVRAVYLNCGAADILAETGDGDIKSALERMWQNMVTRQMYLHGGLGSRYETEGFGQDYELPNDRAHAETCASIGSFMWNWRMLMLDAEARYADVMEQALYNSILAGGSLDGEGYFYQNPLSDDGAHRRQRWFTVSCCPSNLSRLLATLPAYLYSVSNDGAWLHLYAAGRAALSLPDGRMVRLVQRTDYPWSGDVEIEIQSEESFSLFLRLPGWCKPDWTISINGEQVEFSLTKGGYIQIERRWKTGDVVKLHLPMHIQRLESHPNVVENQARVALMRGALLYCLEGVDHAGEDVRRFILPDNEALLAVFEPELLNGMVLLHGSTFVSSDDESWGDILYRPHGCLPKSLSGRKVQMTAIPYYAWANRHPSTMTVWLRTA